MSINTNIPEILNPLKHAGTHQFERLGKELDFDYIKIEERHEADFIAQAEKLAETIQYYNHSNTPFGDWKIFFDQKTATNKPHRALFIAFLRLLEALNEHANGLTKRHLDFYYKEILQFGAREIQPAQAHIFLKCAKTLKERFVASEALLSAGQAEDGTEILFQLVNELVVNKAEIASYYTVYQHAEDFENRLFAKDHSETLVVAPEENEGVPTFGEQQLTYNKVGGEFVAQLLNTEEQTMDQAIIGFAITSPMLRLSEGERNIKIRLTLAGKYPSDFASFQALFKFELTTEEGWFEMDNVVTKREDNYEDLIIMLTLAATHPAIVNYDQSTHEAAYNSSSPVIRMTLKHEASNYGYPAWKHATTQNVGLKIAVTGIRSLLIQNELSSLDASKPFRPFGPIPSIGNRFYIGHPELFRNELVGASLQFKWKDLPVNGFESHYDGYQANIDNNSFKVSSDILEDRVWHSMHNSENSVALFPDDLSTSETSITFDDTHFASYQRKTDSKPITSWDYNTDYGFLRLNLETPNDANFQAFGHTVYAKEVTRNSRVIPEDQKNVEQPYAPFLEYITLNYETAEISLSASEVDQFYQVAPFGERKTTLNNPTTSAYLLPHYATEGELYIGIKEVNTPQTISILFQLAEGSGDATQSQTDSQVAWYYLADDEWIAIDKLRISKDTTENLLKTGIIHFDLPTDCNSEHALMPTGQYWIKASIPEKAAGIDHIQHIYAQGVEIIEQTPGLSDTVLQPKTITKLYNGGKGISKIEQPLASFGGTVAEEDQTYYARVAERLRHKDRGINIWDYERLVLDAFPALYKVKCLNHTNYQTEMVAGHVMVAVIPNLRNKNEKSPFQPKLSMHSRVDIYNYLRERIAPFIYLRIENPIYEPIKLSFNVGFHQGYDEGFYGKKLHQQIQEFLSPWAFENELTENSDLVFGGELHKSTVLKFIEDLPYVDFVNDFNMYHTYQDYSINEYFENEINQPEGSTHTTHTTEGACDIIKLAYQSEEETVLTSLIEIKVRFLKGIVDVGNSNMASHFIPELITILNSKVKKGIAITKTLISSTVKSIYYVDKIVSIALHKDLPNGYVLEDVDVAVAKTSRSIMVTSEQHQIGVYKAGDFNCDGNIMIGIGVMIVEADFIIPETKEETNSYVTR